MKVSRLQKNEKIEIDIIKDVRNSFRLTEKTK